MADFLQTGNYESRRAFHITSSPSMDILISSNLERYLFELAHHDGTIVSQWMENLTAKGCYTLGPDQLASLNTRIMGGWADDFFSPPAVIK